jgi:Flp pilus assembly protein TadG
MCWRKLQRHEEGSSLVEFALSAFMLVMVLLGVVEMGRMILVYTTIANAARTGARYAIVHGGERTASGVDGPSGAGSVTQVQTVVQNFASAGLISLPANAITVSYPQAGTTTVPGSCGVAGNAAGCTVTVAVSYAFNPLLGYYNSMLSMRLNSTSEGVITF